MAGYFTYQRQVCPRSPFGFRAHGCTIRHDGECVAFWTHGDHTRPEIGVYTMRTSADWIAEFWRSLAALDEARAEAPAADPGMPIIAMGRGDDTEPSALTAFPPGAIPDTLRPLSDRLEEIVVSMLEHPERVLQGEAAWQARGRRAGEPIGIDLTLTNIGPATAAFHNPAVETDGAVVELTLRREVGETPFVDERDAATVVLAPAELGLASGPAAHGGPSLMLEPGQSVAWKAERAAYLEPGRWHGFLTLHLGIGDLDPERALDGTLRLPLGTLLVAP